MKISFPNGGSGAGISIRAAVNALLSWHKPERAQAGARKKMCRKLHQGGIIGPESPFGDTRLSTPHERKPPRP
jgi:hypothetical protein